MPPFYRPEIKPSQSLEIVDRYVRILKMGEYRGEANYVQVGTGENGLVWDNVPPELDQILADPLLKPEMVRQVALGQNGRWWLTLTSLGGSEVSRKSSNALDFVENEVKGEILYLNFGLEGVVWGLQRRPSQSGKIKDAWFWSEGVPKLFMLRIQQLHQKSKFEFGSVGLNGEWALGLSDRLWQCDSTGRMNTVRANSGKSEPKVMDITFSPIAAGDRWCQYDNRQENGSVWWHDNSIAEFKAGPSLYPNYTFGSLMKKESKLETAQTAADATEAVASAFCTTM